MENSPVTPRLSAPLDNLTARPSDVPFVLGLCLNPRMSRITPGTERPAASSFPGDLDDL